jgi:hypothetical protein
MMKRWSKPSSRLEKPEGRRPEERLQRLSLVAESALLGLATTDPMSEISADKILSATSQRSTFRPQGSDASDSVPPTFC